MADGKLPDIETLRKLLAYDPETGALTWKLRTTDMFHDGDRSAQHACRLWNSKYAGTAAGWTDSNGYPKLKVRRVTIPSHRVAYAIFHGEWPAAEVDHINGVKGDNRIANLRDVSHAENLRNTKIHRTNTSGRVGVYRSRNKWVAQIVVENRTRYLGRFADFDAACAAREAAERAHGYHHNHGRAA